MVVDKSFLIAAGVLIGVYLVYKLMLSTKQQQTGRDYDKLYNKVLNSDEYKVKGQYDK